MVVAGTGTNDPVYNFNLNQQDAPSVQAQCLLIMHATWLVNYSSLCCALNISAAPLEYRLIGGDRSGSQSVEASCAQTPPVPKELAAHHCLDPKTLASDNDDPAIIEDSESQWCGRVQVGLGTINGLAGRFVLYEYLVYLACLFRELMWR